ncbi:SCO2522 family protein [Streptomyces cylindrosporus]|uniref:SCO2522 family protein n=1 Tax=Streptomyces cylindrosporus TaxID=2927583 RepID=A0ABS9XXV1_9ACTN|nr:SCO2522 family protein [Streptomyces cylindrosporus]MCI3269792.1 SCO2522 family protein [Streptomyces cylindrosporus]
MTDVFRETAAQPRTEAVPLSHLSLELGHLYMEDLADGRKGLRRHFERVRPWADAARADLAARTTGGRPRMSTCFLVDDYFSRFSTPADLLPLVLEEAERAGLVIDYLARESACAVADKVPLAQAVAGRLVESPPPGSYGARPPVSESGWLANGQRSPAGRSPQAMRRAEPWQPPSETNARRHSVFVDVELWDEDKDGNRTWSCPFLAAVWQLARLGLLRNEGEAVLRPRDASLGELPVEWDELPPLVRLNADADPFSAYRTCSVLPARFLSVEHAVRVILDQTDVDTGAVAQISRRTDNERQPMPGSVVERVSYVFYPEP